MVSSDAEKPPMLTNPLALPLASAGVKLRARSKPTIDAGPPDAIAKTSRTSSHIGAGVDCISTTAHISAIQATTQMTITER